MMEVSSSGEGLEKGEDEIELSLELSIGRKSYTKPNPLPQKPMESSCYCPKIGALDCTQETQMGILPRSVNPKMDPAAADPQSKREIQALRRQEARKKREEKLQGKAIPRGYVNDNVVLVKDEEPEPEPPRKKEKNEAFGVVANEEIMVKDLNDNGSNPRGKMQYPDRPELQYVRFTNGLVYTYGVMPGWGPVAGGNEARESQKRVRFEADARRSFRPYNGNIINMNSLERNGNGSKDDEGENGNGKSYGSPGCNSDYQTSSRQGGHSSDTGSNSSKFSQEAMNISSAGNPLEEKSENKCDSKGTESNEVKDKSTTNHIAGIISSSIPRSIEAKCSEEPKSTTKQADPLNRPIATANDPTPLAPFEEETTDEAPIPQTESHVGPSLPQMPCVSTTGNGPNGKTITGFLYRYTKTEVSIVCVCHGTSFSPAEFVEHAGGVDIEHPLRHITVVPSAFS